jgi:crossover junction endodeoxyribonuclease RuvC
MRVLALDPGYGRLGIAVLDAPSGNSAVRFSDCIETAAGLAFPERLAILRGRIEEIIHAHDPEAVALEHIYFSKNQKTAIHVAEVRGMILAIAGTHGFSVFEYTPNQIKVAVTGSGRSDKRSVMSMIPRMVKVRNDIRLDDEYDAIAVGITCLASVRLSTSR